MAPSTGRMPPGLRWRHCRGRCVSTMIKFRFSIVVICVLLPPLFYMFSVQLLERFCAARVQSGLEEVYLGNVESLLNGTQAIRSVINRNVDAFLKQSGWIAWGARAVVTVRTADNTLLYPLNELQDFENAGIGPPPMETAAENYRLLNEKPAVILELRLPNNSPITNAVLGFYTFAGIGLLFLYYRHWKGQFQKEIASQELARQELAQKSVQYEQQLHRMEDDRLRLDHEVRRLQGKLANTLRQTESSEEEMMEEIIALEEEIAAKLDLQKHQQDGLAELQEKIDRLEAQLQKEQARKTKSSDAVQKRLSTLYKNIEVTQRAVRGYLDLTEDMKIKCEEVIHQLDADPTKVLIKRKVFGKKNRETVFEVVFGYKGRLYFLPKETNKNALLAIGTKNSQPQDLAFLDRI